MVLAKLFGFYVCGVTGDDDGRMYVSLSDKRDDAMRFGSSRKCRNYLRDVEEYGDIEICVTK